jgi:hypothetical protein
VPSSRGKANKRKHDILILVANSQGFELNRDTKIQAPLCVISLSPCLFVAPFSSKINVVFGRMETMGCLIDVKNVGCKNYLHRIS